MEYSMIHFDAFLKTLPICGLGLLGVFIVMGAIYLSVWLLCRLTGKTKKDA